MPGVRAIIAVASGKGGVGKSTVAANLALAMKANGLQVGVLDADIYGPSMPRMLGISGRPTSADGKILAPMENYGIKVMSIGFLVPEDTPMIWRGPMVMSALQQMLRDVAWGELDMMIVDMPPGTGDAQLTLAQQVSLAGAVIVSTPQDIALLDARRGLAMFNKVNVPVLGIIENMSYFLCPHCGERSDIFSHGGARREAERLGTDFLGEVPLDLAIRETSDAGTPDHRHPAGFGLRAHLPRHRGPGVDEGIGRDTGATGRPADRCGVGHRFSGGMSRVLATKSAMSAWVCFSWRRWVAAPWCGSPAPGRCAFFGRIGRGANPPPQFGQTFDRCLSTQSAQKVHS